jgi:hypothetical protein
MFSRILQNIFSKKAALPVYPKRRAYVNFKLNQLKPGTLILPKFMDIPLTIVKLDYLRPRKYICRNIEVLTPDIKGQPLEFHLNMADIACIFI